MILRHVGGIAFLLAAAMLALPSIAAGPPGVTVEQGRLAGSAEGGLHVFKGIPYALPPVGELRWRPPAPPASWEGARDATAFGPSCVQPPVPETSIYYDPPDATSEDCLTLNIWAPEDAENLPVIVWIHGGSLRIGGSADVLYDGSKFADRDTVFVSINYRLGALGWLAHPELTAESPENASGNYGLLDQIAALRWIRDNIANFGGNPDNITVMGESAGALSVTFLLVSPPARGLFDKAIIQSTNLRAMPELRETAYGLPSAETIGTALADELGAETLASLRGMDAQELIDGAARVRFVAQGTIGTPSLPLQLLDALEAGQAARVPLLTGFTSGEMRAGLVPLPPVPASAEAYEAEIGERYGDLADDFLAVYPSADVRESMLATLRDAVFGWSSERLAHDYTEAGLPAYLYIFDHCYPAADTVDLCAFHASELPFVFGQTGPDTPLPPNWPRPESEADAALAQAMIDYWVSFARDGVPESHGNAEWRSYSEDEAYLRLAGQPELLHDPFPGMFELHEATASRRRAEGQPHPSLPEFQNESDEET